MTENISIPPEALEKSPTGINGFDDITFGGLPKGARTFCRK